MIDDRAAQDLGDEQPHEAAVELRAGDAAQLVLSFGGAQRDLVGVGRRQHVVDLADGEDPRRHRDVVAGQAVGVAVAVDPLVVGEDGVGDLAEPLDAQQEPRAVGGMALDQPPLGGVQLAAPEQDVVGQRLLADVMQQAGRVDDGLLALGQARRARELVGVVGDGGGVARGGRVAQRQRLQQQTDHALVADVELVGAPHDLLAVRLALEQRPQQQLADAEGEREQPDDAGAVELEAVDGHRGHRRRRQLPRQHRAVHRLEHLQQRAAAQEDRVAGDHREVEEVREHEDDEDRDREPALVGDVVLQQPVQDDPAEQGEGRVRDEVVEQVGPRVRRGSQSISTADARPMRTAGAGPSSAMRGRSRGTSRDPEALRVERR